MEKSVRTVFAPHESEKVIEKSRFITYSTHVESEEEAREFIAKIRSQHSLATHVCYAFISDKTGNLQRFSDDGEPQGTAGVPILEVLKAKKLYETAVAVVRYFGGIKLGAGGLVRAYTQGCVIALNAAQVCEMHPTETWMFEVAYPLWDKVQHTLKSLPVRMENTEFTTAVAFELSVKSEDSEHVRKELVRVTDGRIEEMLEEESYSPWIEEDENAE